MKFFFLFISFFLVAYFSVSQTPGQWTWLTGDSTQNGMGHFGTLGIPDSSNHPPALYESGEWTDLDGNFWLFGGVIHGGESNDLWKYNPVTNEWTWMKGANILNDPGHYGTRGIPSPGNMPPSRGWGITTWTDLNGDLWMFGGRSHSFTTPYNELWRYHIATNEWTWMKGSNMPGQGGVYGTRGVPDPLNEPEFRNETAATWTDSAGNLWLFGGYNGDQFNALWKYDISINQWTWMKGSMDPNQPGVYGIKGVEDSANTPCSRWAYCRWKDNSGNFWLLGGRPGNNNNQSDLWRFNPVTNNWAWMNGDTTINSAGSFGTNCISSPSNAPPARFENRAAWTGTDGSLWFFGGGTNRVWNDLWKYCPATDQWTWISGDTIFNPPGIWGTQGIPGPFNKPCGRAGSVAWTDHNGHLYLFGGAYFTSSLPLYNDLWKYTIDTTCSPCHTVVIPPPVANFELSDTSVCVGGCINLFNLSEHAVSYQWTFSGQIPEGDTSANPSPVCYTSPGIYDISLIARNSSGSDTLTLFSSITVYPAIPPFAIVQSTDTLFAPPDFAYYQWYYDTTLITAATNYFYVATQSGSYNLIVSDTNGCIMGAGIVNILAGMGETGILSDFAVAPNPSNEFISCTSRMTRSNKVDISIYDLSGKKVFSEQFKTPAHNLEATINVSRLAAGMFFLKVSDGEKIITRKLVIVK